jgi:hypothetical protein
MNNPDADLTGRCLCGAATFRLRGRPLRVGICHCEDCRRTSGSAFTMFGIWARAAYQGSGELGTFQGRSFCPGCGSRVVCLTDDEAEIMMGCLDGPPTSFAPEYELWVARRERWLPPAGNAKQYHRDREDALDEKKPG